jgi:exopolysaccharide transport family protein
LQQQDVVGRVGSESAAIESEVEVLQASSLAQKVVSVLSLDQDPEFTASRSLLSFLRFSPPEAEVLARDEVSRREAAAESLQKSTFIKRVGLTYVIEISVTSRSASKAANIANTYAQTYLSQQIEAKTELTRRANTWLNDRLEEQRKQVMAAEEAVELYKRENNLVGQVAGEYLPERQIAKLNEELATARSRTSEAQVKYDQLREAARIGVQAAASFAEVQSSPMIQGLRTQAADLTRREAELLSRYGDRHPRVVNIRAELSDVRRQINEEIARIVATARNELETAKQRQQAYEANLAELKNVSADSNQAGIRLKELERDADATRALFQSFLQRSKETSEQQSLQQADARLVSLATEPSAPSQPKRGLILAAGLVIGLGLGGALAFLMEGLNTGFRTPEDVELTLRLAHLASLPLIKFEKNVSVNLLKGIKDVLPQGLNGENQPLLPTMLKQAIHQPHSMYAEGIRSLRFAFRRTGITGRGGVIALASALPNEGKSTTAANLAYYTAKNHDRTLLIDADVRNPTLTAAMSPLTGGQRPVYGIVEVLAGQVALQDALMIDAETGLHVLGVSAAQTPDHTAELFASPAFTQLLDIVRDQFDVIVMDVPPLLPVVDGRLVMDACDAAFLVVRWEMTPREAVITALRETRDATSKLAGVVLNSVDMDAQRYYDYYRSDAYLKSYPAYRKVG